MTTHPILKTKLFIPQQRAEIVMRPRLNDRLNTASSRKLVLLSAPAGFGKSTLLAAWAAQAEMPVAWLSLDKRDSDTGRFLSYLVAAIQTVAPEVGQGAVELLQASQPPAAEALLSDLLNEISILPEEFALILDDYHAIDAPTVSQALNFLIENLPPQLHLLIATREDPPLPLARLRVRDQLAELRVNDLRFTPTEAAEFLNEIMGLKLLSADVAALEARTEGWIAGLQLAALSMRGQPDTAAFIESFTGSHHFVLDYLLEEVLSQQPENIQGFLLQTAILERLRGPLCDAVVGDEPGCGQGILEYLQQANLFLIPLDNERHWYRYHHLFADLLRQRLQQSATDLPELHARASQWYEDNGFEIEAFQHAAAANDVQRAQRLMAGDGMPLQFRGAMAPVLSWLEALPQATLDAKPALWVTYASTLTMLGRPAAEIETALAAAESALQCCPEDPEIRDLIGQVAASRAMLAVPQNQIDTLITQSQRALEYLHPDNLPTRTTAAWTLGYAYQISGERAAAGQAYAEALATSQASGNKMIALAATTCLAQIQESENQLQQAAITYQDALHLTGDPPMPNACEALLGLGRVHYAWNDLEAAQQYAEQSLPLAQQIDNVDTPAVCWLLLARLALAQGDVEQATKLAAQAEQFIRQRNFPHHQPTLVAMQVAILLRQGQLTAAAELAQAHEIPLSQARVHLAQDDAAAALAILESFRQQADAKAWKDQQLEAGILQALAHAALSEEETALAALSEALSLAQPDGLMRAFLDEGPPMARLLARAAAHGIAPTYTAKLLAAFQAETPAGAPVQPLIDPLSERELEILELIAQGLSNRQISERLFLALDTVKGHNRNIFSKLQVNRRTEAVARARELGLI